MINGTGLKVTVTVTLNMMTLATAAVLQELLLNGGSVAPMKPFSQQMGVADKYEGVAADAARMAMSHPAMLDHADRPHVQFGSVAQFKVTRAAATLHWPLVSCVLIAGEQEGVRYPGQPGGDGEKRYLLQRLSSQPPRVQVFIILYNIIISA